MKLPLFAPRPEAVPTCIEARVALPNVVALVSAGNPDALEAFVGLLRCAAEASGRALRVVFVREGAFAIDGEHATVDVASMRAFVDAVGDGHAVLVGAVVPALFAPAMTIAFSHGASPASFPDAARAIRHRIDATLPDARPGLAERLVADMSKDGALPCAWGAPS